MWPRLYAINLCFEHGYCHGQLYFPDGLRPRLRGDFDQALAELMTMTLEPHPSFALST
ncbi:hypothetical protein OAG71_02550 [bacterium]|nr:hypothetical protein [bacterium]